MTGPAPITPVDRRPPPAVSHLTPAEQVAWFTHRHHHLRPAPAAHWNAYHCDSTQHTGLCCTSCEQDDDYTHDTLCCCKATRQETSTP